MFIRLCVAVASFLLASMAVAADDIDAVLKAAMQDTKTPAMAALVMRDGKIAQQAVRGVRRSDGKTPRK